MDKINVTQNQFSDLINLINGVFFPLKNFVTKEEFFTILIKESFKENFFLCQYSLVSIKIYLNSKIKMFSTYTTKKYLLNIYNVKFYNLDKKLL